MREAREGCRKFLKAAENPAPVLPVIRHSTGPEGMASGRCFALSPIAPLKARGESHEELTRISGRSGGIADALLRPDGRSRLGAGSASPGSGHRRRTEGRHARPTGHDESEHD